MLCKCSVVEFDSALIRKNLGRAWDLGPVVIQKEPGSSCLSVIALKETFEHSTVTIADFKRAILSEGQIPFTVKFSVDADQGLYGFDSITFDDQAVCNYVETRFQADKIEFVFEMVAKGKELVIFNGISGETEQSGDQKPLFWASVLKRDLYELRNAKNTNP